MNIENKPQEIGRGIRMRVWNLQYLFYISAVVLLAGVPAFGAQPAPDLPDPALTPGATLMFPSGEVPLARLCAKNYAHSVRHVSGRTKAAVFAEYGIRQSLHSRYEVDHLIPLELGGSNDLRNLWPQPYGGQWNAHVKDALEDRLHELVCRARPALSVPAALNLKEAQDGIRTDWIAMYKRVFQTGAPLKQQAPSKGR